MNLTTGLPDTANELGLAQEWYSYRDRAYEQIAVDWCQDNEIEYTQSPLDHLNFSAGAG